GINVEKFRVHLQAVQRFVGAVHDGDGIVVVAVLHVDDFLGFLRAEITAGGDEVVVVEMPDHGRPGIIEHPLDHAGGNIFVAAIGFKHGTLVVISLGLRLALEVVERSGRAVALIQSVNEDVDVLKASAAGGKIPILINGPKGILGNEFPKASLVGTAGPG